MKGETPESWSDLLQGNRAHFQPVGEFEERTVYFISLDQRLLDRMHRSIRLSPTSATSQLILHPCRVSYR